MDLFGGTQRVRRTRVQNYLSGASFYEAWSVLRSGEWEFTLEKLNKKKDEKGRIASLTQGDSFMNIFSDN